MALSDIRPTTRRRIGRWSSYAVAAIIVLIIALGADWKTIGPQFFDPEVAKLLWPNIVTVALRNTMLFTLICFVVGTAAAAVLALMKLSSGPAKWFAVGFIEIFRGLPAMLTIFAFAFLIPMALGGFRWPIGTIFGGLIGLCFVTAAYNAEVIRSGIEAVPKGQREAARSLGMSNLTTTLFIILPQGVRIVIPPLTNEFVMLLKDTALLFIVGATVQMRELTTFGRDGLTTYANGTPLILSGILYLIVTIPLTYVVSLLEKTMAVKKQ